MPFREEVLNATLALLLDQYDDITAAAEQRQGSEAIDITVQHNPTNNSSMVVEAKIGLSNTAKRDVVKQARERLETRPKAVAFGLCYPTELKRECSAQELKDKMINTKLTFAHVTRVDRRITWREGSIDDLAQVLSQSDVTQDQVADAIEYSVRQAADFIQSDQDLFNKNFAPILAKALALPSSSAQEHRAAALIASLMVSNATLLHHRLRLAEPLANVQTLKQIYDNQNDDFLQVLTETWEDILEIDYHPVFAPAISVLSSLVQNKKSIRTLATEAIRMLAKDALTYADDLAALRFDHAGPLYHRLLASARYDGSFYTNNVSALLLARLALSEHALDWTDAEQLTRLKIIDPACGTGTLLMAAMHTIRDRHTRAADNPDTDLLHLALVEDVLYGLDINRHGIQLAACNLTLGNPRVDYSRMNLYTMRHGPQPDGMTKAGSLELLATTRDNDQKDIAQFISPLPTMEELNAERAEPGTVPNISLIGKFDVVIMNPPFTRNDIRNRQYTRESRSRVQQRERDIADFVRKRQGSSGASSAGEAIDHTSIETFFTPLADMLLKSTAAVFAKVIPTTALTGSSAQAKRIFLAERFQIETIITSHDPSHINFSENTTIHESLFIARRSNLQRKPTRFISLSRMPKDTHEAMLLADLINNRGNLDEWGKEQEWPWERMRTGNWQAALFYDGVLAEAYYDLAALNGTRLRITTANFIGPAGQGIRGAFDRNPSPSAPWKIPILWDHKTDVHTKMTAEPDVIATPKPGKEQYARGLTRRASRLLIVQRLRTTTVRTAACYTTEPVLGSAWIPIIPSAQANFSVDMIQRALCAWWNSTPGILTMLHARAKDLTYPRYAQNSLQKLLVPDPSAVDISPLVDAFAETHNEILKPWKNMDTCLVRAHLDQAAAQVLHIDGSKIADWRWRITQEPTISGRPAT